MTEAWGKLKVVLDGYANFLREMELALPASIDRTWCDEYVNYCSSRRIYGASRSIRNGICSWM